MRGSTGGSFLCAAMMVTGAAALARAREPGEASRALAETVACKVLESSTSERPSITLAVFHHRDAADRARLGTILRQHNGEPVEFQTADGRWHAATLLRLKTCFGRGLLLFDPGSARFAPGDTFLLKFRAEKNAPSGQTK